MTQLIIFPNDDGSISLITPAKECQISVMEIARKDTPIGRPFRIVDEQSVPEDHTFFNAFEADFSNPDGYGIGPDAWFAEQAMKGSQ